MDVFSAPIIYDLRGLKCPMPVLKTARRLKKMMSGERLMILTDDPLAEQDLTDLCNIDHYHFNSIYQDSYIAFTITVT